MIIQLKLYVMEPVLDFNPLKSTSIMYSAIYILSKYFIEAIAANEEIL
ncbi:hypothetical protein [Peribacillus simplex]|nr:hypothetical protein [Peribacillus simplex]